MQTVTLEITGMSCGHCVASVRQALQELPGVIVDDVRIGQATITRQDDAPPVDAVVDAVNDAGYQASVASAS